MRLLPRGPLHGGPQEASYEPEAALLGDGKLRDFRDAVGKLHGAVIAALEALPPLLLDGRAGRTPGLDLGSPAALAAYLGAGASGGILWPLVVEVAQDRLRPVRPFSRGSALCDAGLERLYRGGEVPEALREAPAFRDSSGASSWHGFSVLSLMGALGADRSYNYWKVMPMGMYKHNVACEKAHGILYDPTACLEQEGWGGRVFYLDPQTEAGEEGPPRRRVKVQDRLRAWGSHLAERGRGGRAASRLYTTINNTHNNDNDNNNDNNDNSNDNNSHNDTTNNDSHNNSINNSMMIGGSPATGRRCRPRSRWTRSSCTPWPSRLIKEGCSGNRV